MERRGNPEHVETINKMIKKYGKGKYYMSLLKKQCYNNVYCSLSHYYDGTYFNYACGHPVDIDHHNFTIKGLKKFNSYVYSLTPDILSDDLSDVDKMRLIHALQNLYPDGELTKVVR